jgi:carboxyl-terminal processing protease
VKRQDKLIVSTTVVVLFVSFTLNLLLINLASDRAFAGKLPLSFDELQLVKEAMILIRGHYVDAQKVDKDKLLHGAIEGMIGKLEDPYSRFMPPKIYKDMKEDTRGSFGGLGMQLGEKNKRLTVISPIVNTPAYRAGILAGDYIVKVDDKDVTGMSVDDVVKILRGVPGTRVKVTIYREGHRGLKEFPLVREEIHVLAVRAQMIDGEIGYALMTSFTQQAHEELEKSLSQFLERGMKAFILDLRHNPGGLLEAAVNVSRLFLSNCRIVTIKSRSGDETPYQAYGATFPGRFPLVILVDSGSASASEIVAGAVRDNKRGILLGQKTFGKGSVQTVLELADKSALALTTAYYYTPGGTCIHKLGVEPDIKVDLPKLDEQQAKEFRELRSKFMTDTLSGLDAKTPAFMKISTHDTQLARAVDILKSSVVFYDKLLERKPSASAR